MSRTKNRSAHRRGQLIIKNRDGSETAVTPMKPWTPPSGYVLTAHVEPDVQPER